MGYQVLPEELRRAADAARSAAEQAGAARLDEPAVKIARALPGSMSGPAAVSTGRSWMSSTFKWREGCTGYGDSLSRSAEEYQRGDQSSADGLGALGGM